jgi:hypothetical protein
MTTGNRVLIWLMLCAAISCGTARSVFAQRGRGFGFGPNRAQLATLKEVQEELNLSEEQIKAAVAATGLFNIEVGELFRKAAGDIEKVRGGMPAVHEKATAKIVETLKPDQVKRMTEIFVQQNGVNSVFDPTIRAMLKLSDEQMATLHVARAANREAGMSASREMPPGETREQRQERFEKLWKESEVRILNVLSKEQRTKFESLFGKELEVNLSPLFPPPPPRKPGSGFSN